MASRQIVLLERASSYDLAEEIATRSVWQELMVAPPSLGWRGSYETLLREVPEVSIRTLEDMVKVREFVLNLGKFLGD